LTVLPGLIDAHDHILGNPKDWSPTAGLRTWAYIVVHEPCHLLERHHTERFAVLMDQHLPRWRSRRQELNSAPLAHESWAY
jgi:YgjP-like, metallopeptidase domain